MLVSAGNVKRDRIQFIKQGLIDRGEPVEEASIAENVPEQEVCTWLILMIILLIVLGV